ncbi:hypothetical protein DSO57_1009206 [Entomophthora muscae]|uniref:Uncharacterized protein n=1 Tax=Entomophthora muscae TaxID=34485 RepID=A0ACC2SW95_9FUNG|nr:hypothetical protein DSO57_1009206 [Entomophthora muscae]
MWFLALAMLNIAIDFSSTAENSKRTLREAQPGIPKVGCFIDTIGFLWCLLVISTSACIMLFAWAYRWKPGSRKPFSRQTTSSMGPDVEK